MLSQFYYLIINDNIIIYKVSRTAWMLLFEVLDKIVFLAYPMQNELIQ